MGGDERIMARRREDNGEGIAINASLFKMSFS